MRRVNNYGGWPAIYALDCRGIIHHNWNKSPSLEVLAKAVE